MHPSPNPEIEMLAPLTQQRQVRDSVFLARRRIRRYNVTLHFDELAAARGSKKLTGGQKQWGPHLMPGGQNFWPPASWANVIATFNVR